MPAASEVTNCSTGPDATRRADRQESWANSPASAALPADAINSAAMYSTSSAVHAPSRLGPVAVSTTVASSNSRTYDRSVSMSGSLAIKPTVQPSKGPRAARLITGRTGPDPFDVHPRSGVCPWRGCSSWRTWNRSSLERGGRSRLSSRRRSSSSPPGGRVIRSTSWQTTWVDWRVGSGWSVRWVGSGVGWCAAGHRCVDEGVAVGGELCWGQGAERAP
jgi:hypothetical protein